MSKPSLESFKKENNNQTDKIAYHLSHQSKNKRNSKTIWKDGSFYLLQQVPNSQSRPRQRMSWCRVLNSTRYGSSKKPTSISPTVPSTLRKCKRWLHIYYTMRCLTLNLFLHTTLKKKLLAYMPKLPSLHQYKLCIISRTSWSLPNTKKTIPMTRTVIKYWTFFFFGNQKVLNFTW